MPAPWGTGAVLARGGARGLSLLEVGGIVMRFGGVVALDGPSFSVGEGRVCGLIGPNGAGKTTLFNCVSRLAEPAEGSIRFDGTELLDKRAHEIAALGIARTFQHLALVPALTVRENVMLGAHHRTARASLAAALHLPEGAPRGARDARRRRRGARARRACATSPAAPSRASPTASSSGSSSPARSASGRGC